MKEQQNKIGIREYMAMVFLVIGAKASEDTTTTIYNQVQNAAWMVPILSGILITIPLFFLLKTMPLFKNKNLFEVIQKVFGKFFGFVICSGIFLLYSMTISIDSRTYADIIRNFYFITTPHVVIYGILMFVCAYGAKKGIVHVASVAYIIVFYSILAYTIVFLLSLHDSNLQAISPIWGTGIGDIMRESVFRLNLYVELIILALLFPHLKSFKEFKKGTWWSLIPAIFLISLATLVYVCLFDHSLATLGYPYHSLIRYISFGTFLGNIEIFIFPIWLLGSFIRFTVALYLGALMFGQLFKIKDYEYLIPVIATVYLLIGSIPETPMDVSLFIKPIIRNIVGPTYFILAILLWLVALLKGEFKHEKSKKTM